MFERCESCVVAHKMLNFCLSLHVMNVKYLLSTTVPPLKQKGKVPVQEAKTPDSPKLKSKFTRIPKEKEPEPEVVKLKKIPVKAPEPEKQVVTHKAQVTRHHDIELTVHGLHDRDDREIITLGRTERVFTAEEETVQFGQFEKAERVEVIEKTEKESWTRTPKPQKEEESEAPPVEKKKITKLPKADEQKESVKLKPFDKSGKPEEEPQKIQLKKVPSKPKEPEKEVTTTKADVTRHYDTMQTAQKVQDREDREVATLGRTERSVTAAEEPSEVDSVEKPEKPEAEDEKSRWIRTPKAPKDEEPEPDLTKKKIKRLPRNEEEPEVVTLKPFEKAQKPESAEPQGAQKEGGAKAQTEHIPFKRAEKPKRDQPSAAVKRTEDEGVPTASLEVIPDVSKDQTEVPQKKKTDKLQKDGEDLAADKLRGKPRTISTPDKEKEQVVLKPLSKDAKPEEKPEPTHEEEKQRKPGDTKIPSRTPRDEIPKEPKEQQLKKVEKTETPKEEEVKSEVKEPETIPPKKPSPPEKKDIIQKKEDKEHAPKPTQVLKKGVEIKKTPSPRVGKDKEEEKVPKPVEQLKKVELKKTPSPKAKEVEQVPVEKKPSAEKVKRTPKTVSPKDSIEAITLKKVPKKPSPEVVSEAEKPGKGRVPLVKEVSPGAVQMKKVPTQPEEEVFEEEQEEIEGEEDEEAWGWELVPTEDWEGEGVDGALETPGMPGSKRGETKANRLSQMIPDDPLIPSEMAHLILITPVYNLLIHSFVFISVHMSIH